MIIKIGEKIKNLRKEKGITQEKLAEVLNVSSVAVCKWETGETYPDITLLFPIASYFKISIDELMGYDQERVKQDIESIITLYRSKMDDIKEAKEIITKAYKEYPSDYNIMSLYMWNKVGGSADNNKEVLLKNKDEFLLICDRIEDGCKDARLILSALNMRAKILHAEEKTEEALKIYETKFASWYETSEQKSEQLFDKDTTQYYYWVKKNLFNLTDLASDKLGRVVFFDKTEMEEKVNISLSYSDLMFNAYKETNEVFFLTIAYSFLGRICNDLVYRGGSDENIIMVTDKHLCIIKEFNEVLKKDHDLRKLFMDNHSSITNDNILKWYVEKFLNASSGRRKELLENLEYVNILNKYNKFN